ncbi:Ryanodine receptor 3, partial [Taenia solium]
MLTSFVIYPCTDTTFNFFRKFNTKEEDGEKEYKCDFHITPLISSFSQRSKCYLLSPLFFSSSVLFPTSTRVCERVVELEMRFDHPMETHMKRYGSPLTCHSASLSLSSSSRSCKVSASSIFSWLTPIIWIVRRKCQT